ncbi:sulfite exporter TauE/SafE family protein [Prosthecomicrobium sp. N25]|uniref:sulfite exporter TauE/SafE family protein n=1 Tax=Prosthecomicrobium sp. N25 TaxID=3129254 RepID=UPI0030775F32
MDSLVLTVALGAALAGFVQGLSGFAFSMVSAAVWAWTVPPQVTAPLLVFGSFLGQLLAVPAMRRGFSVRAVAPFVAGGLAGVPIGVAVLPHVDPVWFKAGIGAFLVVYCPFALAAAHLPKAGRQARVLDGAVGMAGGVLGGIAGMTGALPTLWCTMTGWERDEARAVIQSFNLAMHTTTLTAYLVTGTIGAEAARLFLVVAPAMLVPTLLGARLYRGISDAGFRRLVLLLLTAAGVMLLAGSVPALWGRVAGG